MESVPRIFCAAAEKTCVISPHLIAEEMDTLPEKVQVCALPFIFIFKQIEGRKIIFRMLMTGQSSNTEEKNMLCLPRDQSEER